MPKTRFQPGILYTKTIHQIGCVQIDTLHMVAAASIWSCGVGWEIMLPKILTSDFGVRTGVSSKAGSMPPRSSHCLNTASSCRVSAKSATIRPPGTTAYLDESLQKEFVPQVLERIRNEGALKVSNFESDGHPGGAWWNWRPAKVALEILYANGDLMIADRINFQRVYDLTERVLPQWVDRTEPTAEERDRFWVELGARALGVCQLRHSRRLHLDEISHSRPIVAELIRDGTLIPITGKLANGESAELIIHRDNLSLLEQAADGALKAGRTTFLSPFDNLWWASRRDEQFWGFHQSIEAYLPAPKRVYGYFCLPILHKERLVGRFDPKLERKTGILRLKPLYLEPGYQTD